MGKVSYKIDRIISSNDTLTLGLKNPINIKTEAAQATLDKLLVYNIPLEQSTSINEIINNADKNVLITKGYATDAISTASAKLIKDIVSNTVFKSDETGTIKLSYDAGKTIQFGLNNAYDDSELTNGNKIFANEDTKQVVSGLTLDKFGRITSVQYKAIKTSDLGNDDNTFDNYYSWAITAGETTREILSYSKELNNALKVVTEANKGLSVSLGGVEEQPTLNINLLADVANSFSFDTSTGNLQLKKIGTKKETEGLYKFTTDDYGRVTSTTAVTNVTDMVDVHTAGKNGLVNAGGSVVEAAAKGETSETKFYTSNAQWATIPFNKVETSALSGSEALPILVADNKTDTLIKTKKSTNVSITGDGTLSAVKFSGDGSALTGLNGRNITSGEVSYNVLPEDVKKVVDTKVGNIGTPNNDVLYLDQKGVFQKTTIKDKYQPNEGNSEIDLVLSRKSTYAAESGVTTSEPTWVDLQGLVKQTVAGDGGMRFMGTIGKAGSGATLIDKLPAEFQKGDFYKIVSDDMTLAGYNVDAGDTIYAIQTKDSKYNDLSQGSYWSVLQANLDNPLIVGGENSIKDGTLLIHHSTPTDPGTIAAGSVEATADENGTWTLTANLHGLADSSIQLETPRNLWGNAFNGTKDIGTLTENANISHVANITTDKDNTHDIGSSTNKFKEIFATTFNGDLKGNAGSANKVNNKLTINVDGAAAIEYDGSVDKTLDLTSETGVLKDVLKNVTITPTSGAATNITGVIKSITATSTELKNHVVTITPTYSNVLSSINSTILTYDSATNSILFNAEKSDTNTFYTNTTSNKPDETKVVGFNGQLLATDLQILDRTQNQNIAYVAQNKPKSAELKSGVGKKILVANEETGKGYGFINSGVEISNSVVAGDKSIATSGAVKTYVDNKVVAAVSGASSVIMVDVTTTDKTSTALIPTNAIIEHVDIAIEKQYDKTSGFTIQCGNEKLVEPTEMDLTSSSVGDTYSYKLLKANRADNRINISGITSGETGGHAVVYVHYSIPMV